MGNNILVLPKGRLYPLLCKWFKGKMDIDLPSSESRVYFYENFFGDCSLFLAKPKSIPQLIHSKVAVFGICGEDIIVDNDIYDGGIKLLYKFGLNTVKICLCANKTKEEIFKNKGINIVATEFPNISSRYFTERKLPHYCLNTFGSTEGFLNLGADCIIDVVDSGKTLKENGISVLDVLFESTTSLFVNNSIKEDEYPKIIKDILSCK